MMMARNNSSALESAESGRGFWDRVEERHNILVNCCKLFSGFIFRADLTPENWGRREGYVRWQAGSSAGAGSLSAARGESTPGKWHPSVALSSWLELSTITLRPLFDPFPGQGGRS